MNRPDPNRLVARLLAFGAPVAGLLLSGSARAGAAIRTSPKLAAAMDAVVATWDHLVDAFCAVVEPLLMRWFPEHRLVAMIDEAGAPVLHRIVKGNDGLPKAVPVAADRDALAGVDWTAIELRLPSQKLLRRSLSLPPASRDFLGQIIEHRLERLTPWAPQRVLYGYRVVDGAETSTLDVAFLATSRDLVAAPLAALADLGLVPTAIGAGTDTLTLPLDIDLQRGGAPPARPRSRTLVSRVALASLCGLVALAIGTGLLASNADAARDDTAAKLVKARRLLRSASLGVVGDREKAMLEAKQPDRAMMVLVDRLASAIPADTFLRELAIGPTKVRLVGSSSHAPALVASLEGAGLRNVRFTAATTREKDGRDSFEIGADRAAVEAQTP